MTILKEDGGVLTSGSNNTDHTLSEDILTELEVKKGDDLVTKSGLYQLFSAPWVQWNYVSAYIVVCTTEKHART